jgi:hypothetical protein
MQARVLQTHYYKTTNLSSLSKDHYKLWPKKNSVDQRSIVFSLFSFFSPLFLPFKHFSFKRFSLLKKLLPRPKKNFKTLQKITKKHFLLLLLLRPFLTLLFQIIFQQRTWLFNRLGSAPKTKLQNTSKWQRNTFFFPFKLFSFKRFSNRELRCLRDCFRTKKKIPNTAKTAFWHKHQSTGAQRHLHHHHQRHLV